MQVLDAVLARRGRLRMPVGLGLALLVAGCSPTLNRFERMLAANDSATAALGQWCAARGIAAPATIRAIALRPGAQACFAAAGAPPIR